LTNSEETAKERCMQARNVVELCIGLQTKKLKLWRQGRRPYFLCHTIVSWNQFMRSKNQKIVSWWLRRDNFRSRKTFRRGALEREVFYLGVSFKLKGLHHAPWETDSLLNCFAQEHTIAKRPWNALVL